MVQVNPTDKLVFDLEMLQIDYNEQKKNALKKEISEKYGVPLKNIEINFIPITIDENGDKLSLTSDIISNIQDPKFQQKLFNEYLELRDIKDVNMDEIYEIDNSVNAFVDFDSYSKYKSYKFKYVKWDNYLSYGKGNYFDFTQLHGLILLNGYPENQCGKTTFAIDLLRFALFGKADKTPTLDSVFNKFLPEETEVMVEAGLEIDNIDYVIRRTITRPALSKRTKKSKSKQKIEYFKVINGELELIENCEAESATQTNNVIRESVGSIEDFNLVISANAYNLGELLKMGQADKSRLFSKWLGLLSLEDKEKVAKEIYKTKISPSLMSNKYDKTTLSNEVVNMTNVITNDRKNIIDIQEKLEKTNVKINEYNEEKIKIVSNRKEIKDNLIKIDVATVENNLSFRNSELETKRGQLSIMKDEYQLIKDAIFDIDVYNSKQKELRELEARKGELRISITHLKNDNERINKLISGKLCPTCGHEIDMVEQNQFIDKNNKEIDELIKEGVSCKEKGEKIQKFIAEMEIQRNNVEKLNNLKLKMTAVKAQIDNIKLQIENLERQKNEIEQNKENIKYNNDIDNKIRIVDENIKVETKVKEDCIRQIQAYNSEISNYEKLIDERNKIISKLDEEDKIIRNWTIYQQLVGKNGIIKIALKRALPVINNEISRILNGLCDFTVDISISEDNKVCLDFIRDGEKFDLSFASSGYEGTMASLAIRSALAKIGNMPKNAMLVLDEVLAGVAISNYDNVKELYQRILGDYDYILHICHESTAEDWHEHVLTVTKDNNISKITYK